jgi:hypothetical protein
MNRKTIAIIVLGLVLVASLLACGYFGVKTLRRTRLRRAAMTAYEKKEYLLAERLLQQYVRKDPNAEAEFVALANIYHEFGNTGMEVQMWQTASSLNPLNRDYYNNMLTSAVRSANYAFLHGILGRKAKLNEEFTDQELYLYVISSFRSVYQKDGDDAYRKAVKDDPEAFHKSELGQMAEFMVNFSKLSEVERTNFLNQTMESEDPVVRFEALYTAIRRAAQQDDNDVDNEGLLKKTVETNYFVGTPLLVDYYFSRFRFSDVIEVAEPYLKTIDDLNTYLMYAESLIFCEKLDELKVLEKKLRKKGSPLPFMADYCNILIAYLEEDEEKLAANVRNSGKLINSPLSRFIRLHVAIESNSFNEILIVARDIFSSPPFHDLSNRAMLVCLDYLSEEMKKAENRNEPSQMAELAKILSPHLEKDQLITEIILMDQYKKGLLREEDLMSALEQFPNDTLLQRVTAEFLVLNGKSGQALSLIEQIEEASKKENQELDRRIHFLHMLALDQLGRLDEASVIFRKLVEQSEFDLDLLHQFFQFSWMNKRENDLKSMADMLDTVKEGELKDFGKFFHAAALLASEDKSKENEALDMLASTPTGNPDFTFYAANRLSEHDRLDEAEAKYRAILKTYRNPPLIFVNLSELYHAKGDEQNALETAKEAFGLEKNSMLPALIYAKRLSEAGHYEEAVSALAFPHHAVTFRDDVVALWVDCMHHVIEKSMADRKHLQAEEQCKYLLIIAPDDEFGQKTLAEVREILKPKKDEAKGGAKPENAEVVPAA